MGDDYPHLKMGNPSQATTNESQKNNFLMKKEFFALSHNNAKGTPNCQLASEQGRPR